MYGLSGQCAPDQGLYCVIPSDLSNDGNVIGTCKSLMFRV
jgi:hypothetical protein